MGTIANRAKKTAVATFVAAAAVAGLSTIPAHAETGSSSVNADGLYSSALGHSSYMGQTISGYAAPIGASSRTTPTAVPAGRIIEAVEGRVLHEIYSTSTGNWVDGAIAGVPAGVTAAALAYNPTTGGRVIEAVQAGALHEIYSTSTGWVDGTTAGVPADVTAVSVAVQ